MSRELYRDTANGKLSGVCAGVANYFGAEIWLVRILVMSAALLGGTFIVLLAYIAMSFMLEKQPASYQQHLKTKQEHKLKQKPWQQGQQASHLLAIVEKDMQQLEAKIQHIEAYVTSESYQVNKQFNQL